MTSSANSNRLVSTSTAVRDMREAHADTAEGGALLTGRRAAQLRRYEVLAIVSNRYYRIAGQVVSLVNRSISGNACRRARPMKPPGRVLRRPAPYQVLRHHGQRYSKSRTSCCVYDDVSAVYALVYLPWGTRLLRECRNFVHGAWSPITA